jgi:hypothetical protein
MTTTQPTTSPSKTRSLIAASAIAAALAFTGSASAFSGPWDSAHQPPTITNPGVSVNSDTGSFDLDLAGIACPGGVRSPLTITLSILGGEVVDSLSVEQATSPLTGAGCYSDQTWTESTSGPNVGAMNTGLLGATAEISLNQFTLGAWVSNTQSH